MKVMNPVLPGFNPDPSLVRVGDDYYIATSTFEWFPGVCIHHSKDLVNWEIISYVLTDEATFDIRGMDSACGIWAPNLTYDKGIFYMVTTIVYTNRHRFKDTHNFLVTAADVKGPWSKPVQLNRTGFDPSLFHDPNGKKWLVNMLFDYRLDHKRFGGVGIQEYDPAAETLTGPVYNIFKGSAAGTTEGPNIFWADGYYYLVTAEGGTGFDHQVTLCRAQEITGPYELCPHNPLLSAAAKEGVNLKRAGHGQIIKGADGAWYMAHLCSRTLDNCSILGRETALQNLTKTDDGWFKMTANSLAAPEDYFEVPVQVQKKEAPSGLVDFADPGLLLDYMTLRQSRATCGLQIADGKLHLTGGNSLSSKYNQAFLARRQQHFSYDFTAEMEFEPRNFNHMAGVVCYYNYDNYHYLYMSRDDEGRRYLKILTMENKEPAEGTRIDLAEADHLVYLKAEVRERTLQFMYSLDHQTYDKIGEPLDMRILSDERIAGNGFTGAMVGVNCQDLSGDGTPATIAWMEYNPQ